MYSKWTLVVADKRYIQLSLSGKVAFNTKHEAKGQKDFANSIPS